MPRLEIVSCLDSPALAAARRRELLIPRDVAAALGRSALQAARDGHYTTDTGETVEWRAAVEAAIASKWSVPPDAVLPPPGDALHSATSVQVSNETTLGAARRLWDRGVRTLVLNFANGVHPGGGFLEGARAQEEALCRSSALYVTLVSDPMYDHHRQRPLPDATDWAILSPDVPVFRTDAGTPLGSPWPQSFLTCAAPYAPAVGLARSGDLLHVRIGRALAIARARGFTPLVLGAWGCGAFGNDPRRTATSFREALEGPLAGAFRHVQFAVTDWSQERRTLGPFRDVFAAGGRRAMGGMQ